MAKRSQVPEGKQRVRVSEGVYLKKSGRYLAMYRDPGRKQHWKEFGSHQAAKRWRAKALLDPASVQEGRRTLDEVWSDYLKHHGSGLRPNTREAWTQQWQKHIGPRLGSWPVGRINVVGVKDFLSDLEQAGVGAPTRQKCRTILHRVFEEAVENGEMMANPAAARGTRVKSDSVKKARVLTPAEVTRVLSAAREVASPSDALAIETIFMLGLRIGELAGLQARDVDRDRHEIAITRTVTEPGGELLVEATTKTGKVRVIPVPKGIPLWERLVAHINDQGLIGQAHLFQSLDGGVMRPSNFRKRTWVRVMREAGIPDPLTPHSARRTAASLLAQAGVHPNAIRAIMGHSTLRMTDAYVDISRAELEAGMGRLADLLDA